VPTGFVFGTTFSWTRVHVAGINPANGSGTGVVDEVLTDSLLTPISTSYVFTLVANGCTHVQSITVTVDPTPPVGIITTAPPHELCTNTMYQNFGAASLPPTGQDFHWAAQNATVWATGAHGQYALVNFDKPGTAVVTLISNLTGSRCANNNTYTVTVGSGVSDAPQVYYFNGELICMQADEDSYQWGFDDDVTLDSTLIEGAKNPDYFISGADFTRRHYWVITRRGDCMQKSYYNAPTGIKDLNADAAEVKLYPNPANELVNIEISASATGNFEVEVYNMMGQNVRIATMSDHKATVNIAGLPSGAYLVNCVRDGVKVATQRFIKN